MIRVLAVDRWQVFGTREGLEDTLAESAGETSIVERQNGTDQGRDARKAMKT